MATQKKITKVEGGSKPSNQSSGRVFTPTAEAESQAGKFRMYGIILWALAVVAEVIAMLILFKKDPEVALNTGKRVLLIVILLVDLVLLIAGSSFWKKANRFDPASKQNALKFFFQNQLGVLVALVAFLPVVILAFIKKEYLVGAIAALFMVGGGAASADYNPASQEQYSEQTTEVEALTGVDHVYWTKSGTKFHLYDDCRYINSSKTTEIFQGTVAQARELKNISELCSACKDRVMKEKGITNEQLQQAQQDAQNALENTTQKSLQQATTDSEEPQTPNTEE
jgi:nitrogen fixation/metabolism regulation signal transduction histidine kinase